MNKKADLSLSTNAIVVLIIAITILGLSLAFTRGIFDNLAKKIQDMGGRTSIDNPAKFEEPMTISTEKFEIRKGKTADFKVGFFNKDDFTMMVKLRLESCYDENGDNYAAPNEPSQIVADIYDGESSKKLGFVITSSGAKESKMNEDIVFSNSLKVQSGTPSGVYSCTFAISFDSSEDESFDNRYEQGDSIRSKDVIVTVV